MHRYIWILLMFIFISFLSPKYLTLGQGTTDPSTITVFKSSAAVTVDGNLDESIWTTDLPHLKFKIGGESTGNNELIPTGFEIIKPPYADTTTTMVRFAYSGMSLYISLESDDKQVCRFGDSWEGDGLFMKIKNASGADVEYKLYYNLGGADPEIHYEGPAHSEGAGVKGNGTIVNDSTNVDGGYTAELRIDLAGLGYTSLPSDIDMLINIFDPDNYSDGVPPWGPNGNFAKQWWGSQWGPDTRTIHFDVNTDPSVLNVYPTTDPIAVDGNLTESNWSLNLPRLKYEIGSLGLDSVFVPTGFEIIKPPYADTTTTMVRFAYSGMSLYISLESDDKQVCRFGDSWEGDGLFMKIKNASGADVEYKLYYNLGGADPEIHYEGPAHSEGAGVKGNGTIVNDSTNVDGGYTAELRIDLAGLGYTSLPSDIDMLINIFDPDNYSDGVPPWGPNGNFAKQWWGSQWGPDTRTIHLVQPTSVEDQNGTIPKQFNLSQNYPNPFNPSTKINFSLPVNAQVKIDVINILGQRIKTLVDADYSAGNHELIFDASNLSSGIYIYRIDANGQNGKLFSSSKKMILMK